MADINDLRGAPIELQLSNLEQAGKYGSIEAYMKIGELHMSRREERLSHNQDDLITQGELDSAIEAYKKAALRGSVEAHIKCAELIIDLNKSFDHYKAAAELGHAGAQFMLGNNYKASNLENAKEWWAKAADQGHTGAQIALGTELVKGEDKFLGLDYLKKAADKGHTPALNELDKILDETGKEYKELSTFVLSYYEDYADRNPDDGWFQNKVGNIYREGRRGVEKDIKKARGFYERAKAAKNPHPLAQKALDELNKPPSQ